MTHPSRGGFGHLGAYPRDYSEPGTGQTWFGHDAFTSYDTADTVLLLSHDVIPDSVHVYLNGIEQLQDTDYTLGLNSVQVLAPMEAADGDTIDVRYAYITGDPPPDLPVEGFGPPVSRVLSPYAAEVSGTDILIGTVYHYGDFSIRAATSSIDFTVKSAIFTYAGDDLGMSWRPVITQYYYWSGLGPQEHSAVVDPSDGGPILSGPKVQYLDSEVTGGTGKTYKGTLFGIGVSLLTQANLACLAFGAQGDDTSLVCGTMPDSTSDDEPTYQLSIDYDAGFSSFTSIWHYADGSTVVGATASVDHSAGGTLTFTAPVEGVVTAVEISATDYSGSDLGVILRHYFY